MIIIARWQQKSVQLPEDVLIELPNGATAILRKSGLVKLSANYQCKVFDENGKLSVESMWVNEFVLHSGHLEFDLLEETVTFTTS